MRLIILLLSFISFFVIAQDEFDLTELNVGAKGKYTFREFSKDNYRMTIIRIPNEQNFQAHHNLCRALIFDAESSPKIKGKYLYKKNTDINIVYTTEDTSVASCKNWEKYTDKYIQVDNKIEDGVLLALIHFVEGYDFSQDTRFSNIKCNEAKITAIRLDDTAFHPHVVNSINFRCSKSAYESKLAYNSIDNKYIFLSVEELI